jgi:hypothetical protein
MTPIPLGILALSGVFASGAFDLLETTTLTTSASSVTFSGLGAYSDYKHLQIRGVMRTVSSPFTESFGMRLNSRSTSGQYSHELSGNGSGVESLNRNENFIKLAAYAPGGTATTGAFMPFVIDILDYSNSSKNTTIRSFSGYTESATPARSVYLTSGLYALTTAITSIQIGAISGPFLASGSRFSLIGIK